MTQPTLPTLARSAAPRPTMNGKPVYEVPAKSVINFTSGFGHKLLCDSLTFSAGSACAYSCTFCYVEDLMRKSPHLKAVHEENPAATHGDIIIRRHGVLNALRSVLTDRHGKPKFPADDRRVIYASPLVDIAANPELMEETGECCKMILNLTSWDIRLLSKSNLLPQLAQWLDKHAGGSSTHNRVIFGVSTGTLDDTLARSFEKNTALVSKRLESLHWLQDHGFRTYGMICPSLPQRDYAKFAREMAAAIRADRCEHVWAECMNVRGESMTKTCAALRAAGYEWEAAALEHVANDKQAWETYSRATFEAHAALYEPSGVGCTTKLRFLQYVTKESKPWWQARELQGAVLL